VLQEQNRIRSAQDKLLDLFANFPLVKRFVSVPDHDDELGSRSHEVMRAKAHLYFWSLSEAHDPRATTCIFLALIEALESERQKSLRALNARIEKLETELTLAKATPSSKDATGNHSGDISTNQSLEGYENNVQLVTISQSSLSSDLFEIEKPTRLNSVAPIQIAQPQKETSRSSTTQRRKDRQKLKFQCVHCGKIFTRATTLRDHYRSPMEERRWACASCPKQFVRRKDFKRHVTTQHAQKTIECGRLFQLHGRR